MSPVAAIAAWVVTFAVHSTVVVSGVWLLCRSLRSPALREALWKLALVGAFASSSLQLFGFGAPLLDLTMAPRAIAAMLATAPAGSGPVAGSQLTAGLWLPEVAAVDRAPFDPLPLVAAAAVLLAALGVAGLLRARLRLHRCLRRRRPLGDSRVLATAAMVAQRLSLQQTPRLSCSDELASPIAFGWLRPEICLPSRATDLGDGELRAMLTHELMHLIRRDPGWLWLSALAQGLAPWQPLLWLARRRLLHLAELQCDAEASRRDGGVTVARCLLEVAGWHCEGRRPPVGALAMAAKGQLLRERVEQALAEPAAERRLPRALLAAGAAAALLLLTAAAPGATWLPADDAGLAVEPVEAPASPLALELQALDAEAAVLRQQASALQQGLGSLTADPEFAPLLHQLQQRLTALEQLRARLQARRGVSQTPTRDR